MLPLGAGVRRGVRGAGHGAAAAATVRAGRGAVVPRVQGAGAAGAPLAGGAPAHPHGRPGSRRVQVLRRIGAPFLLL